ncbi:hypothetical protein [Coxiella-like endosymbiont]|uniref:hypothetical protein n=1 Tax=Coxiella-like endosymbiont TaxID=1592897 RepID=UPI00272C6BFD|nr:hypothetical protein [Coxiella-like endosymbiont]
MCGTAIYRYFNQLPSKKLTVQGQYTRRGGLDINPIRSTEEITPTYNLRMLRQ